MAARRSWIWAVAAVVVTCTVLWLQRPAWSISGHDWIGLPEEGRNAYVAGLADAWNRLYTVQQFATERSRQYRPSQVEETFGVIGKCINERQIPYRALTAMVQTYLEEHPNEAPHDMAVIAFGAMSKHCKVP